MKKKLLLFILVGMLGLTGCSQVSADQDPTDILNEDSSDDGEEVDDESDADSETDEDDTYDKEEDEVKEETHDKEDEQSFEFTVYYSNNEATAFESEEVQVSVLTPETVLDTLIDKGMVGGDAGILSFEIITVEGKKAVEIDFNEGFSSFIFSMGSTGEYYTIGSICNTFLDAYDCEQIKITVEGRTLETGHTDYPGYMEKFS